MTNIKPLGNRVLVKRAEAQTTKGGILLPDSAQEKPREGTVLAVGPGKLNDSGTLETSEVKVGDRVLFGPYSGTEVSPEGDEKLLVLADTEIFGVLS